jgi:hypothetical protein
MACASSCDRFGNAGIVPEPVTPRRIDAAIASSEDPSL